MHQYRIGELMQTHHEQIGRMMTIAKEDTRLDAAVASVNRMTRGRVRGRRCGECGGGRGEAPAWGGDRVGGLFDRGGSDTVTVMREAQLRLLHAPMVGLMPITGIPLPFFSYGGSFMLATWISIGLLVRVSGLGRGLADSIAI